MDNLKRTSLFSTYEKYGGKVVEYAGWSMPVQFEGLVSEHEAVRNAAGLFDVSHMGEIEIKGKGAESYLQYLLTNNVRGMHDTQVLYNFMCYPTGGVVDDLLVYRYNTEYYLLVVNASNMEKDYAWMVENKGQFAIDIINLSNDVSELALQGPVAEIVLQKLTDTDLTEIAFFHFKSDVKIAGANCIVSRTGYTGEDGFEIYLNHHDAPIVWDKILEVGAADGVKPIGLGARDTLRFEANLPLYGNEMNQDITPLEAGYGFFVKLDKEENFIGKEALAKQKQEGLKRKVVGFEMVGNGIPRHGYEVLKDEVEVGVVTTGYYSPTLKKNIGLALIDTKYADLDSSIDIKIRKNVSEAKVCNRNFLKRIVNNELKLRRK